MNLLFDPTIRLLEKAAGYRVARQEVVASNLANTDTPGYVSKDVPFEAFLAQAQGEAPAAPAATNPRHFGAGPAGSPLPPPVVEEADPAKIDGNNVVLEKEMAKMAENTIGYLTEVNLIARKLRMIRTAIDDAARA